MTKPAAVAAPVAVETKAVVTSRRPENKKARRIIRRFLAVSLIATDEAEDAAVREIALAEATELEAQMDAALALIPWRCASDDEAEDETETPEPVAEVIAKTRKPRTPKTQPVAEQAA